MIQLSQAQAARTVDLLADGIGVLDQRLDNLSDDEIDERPDLIEEHEQASRLRELIISQLGKTDPMIWECADDGCAWLNTQDEALCNQCGQERAA